MEKQNSQLEHGQPMGFDVRTVLHGQVSFAAVNQIFVIHV